MKQQWSHDNKTVKIVRWEGTPFLWYEYIQIHTVISQLTLEILEKNFQLPSNSLLKNTVERWFNEPLYNEDLDITSDFLQPRQNWNKMYGTEPRYN